MKDYLIIGADAAGLSAAIQIKKKHPDAAIKVINKGTYISYGACGIPYVISGDVQTAESLIHFTPESFHKMRGIPVEIHQEAINIFPDKKKVEIRNLETGDVYSETYGRLLIATGSEVRKLPFIDHSMEGVFNIHNIEDLKKITAFMEKHEPKKAVIIGAGAIGLEVTEALHTQGIHVTLLEALAEPAASWPSIAIKALKKKIQEKGVEFHSPVFVQAVEKQGSTLTIKTKDQEFEAEMLFTVVGTKPATDFCGDKLDKMKNGAILIDRFCRTSATDIYAAGDCASVWHLGSNKNTYMPLGSTANKLGRLAGMNMAGEKIEFPGVAGTQIFKFFELSLARTGVSLEEAEGMGLDAASFSVTRMDRAGYYPGAENVKMELVSEKGSGKILGATAVSLSNAAMFIDPVAVAITGGMTITDLAWLDSAYAPPFAPVWNALISAAFKGI